MVYRLKPIFSPFVMVTRATAAAAALSGTVSGLNDDCQKTLNKYSVAAFCHNWPSYFLYIKTGMIFFAEETDSVEGLHEGKLLRSKTRPWYW